MIKWDERYTVGDPEIDRQHQHIAELINAVETAATTGDGAHTIDMVLTHLTRFLVIHFSCEERLMEQIGYPRLEEHIVEHETCSRELGDMLAQVTTRSMPLEDALGFLGRWLDHHVLTSDRDYVPYIKSQRPCTGCECGLRAG